VPETVVTNLGYNADSVNATHAELTWNAIDIDVRKIHGFFRGYQVTGLCSRIKYSSQIQ